MIVCINFNNFFCTALESRCEKLKGNTVLSSTVVYLYLMYMALSHTDM